MRAASYIDFQNAVKMDQQDSAPSGLSVLTPLPTYLPHNPNEGRTDDVMANDNLMDFKIASEANNFPVSGRLTPQTPEPILYHEPLNMNTLTESWIKNPSWSDDSIMSLGSSYDSDMTAFLPTDMWSTTHFMNLMPVHQMSWPQPQYSYSPQSMSSDMVPHARAVPPLSIGDYSVDNCNNSGTFQNGWSDCQIASDQSDLIGLVSCAPFDLNLSAFPSTSPIWEDVFVPAQPY